MERQEVWKTKDGPHSYLGNTYRIFSYPEEVETEVLTSFEGQEMGGRGDECWGE